MTRYGWRRYAVGAASGALVVSALAACGSSSSGTGSGSTGANAPALSNGAKLLKELHTQKITITVSNWGTNGGDGHTAAEDNAEKAAFEKKFPNITIKPSTLNWWNTTDVGVAWYTAMEAGNIPNVGELPFTEPSHMEQDGYAANIAPELKLLGWTKYLNPTVLKIISKGSAIYGLPESDYYMGLYINPILFKKAGLWDTATDAPEVPKTWTQVQKDADTVTKKDPGDTGFLLDVANTVGGWNELNILRAYGCNIEGTAKGKYTATYDGPNCVKAMNLIKSFRYPTDTLESNYLESESAYEGQIGAGKVGMTIMLLGELDSYEQQFGLKFQDFSLWPLPSGPTGLRNSVLGGVYGTFSPKDTPLQILAGLEWIETQQALDPLGGKQIVAAAEAERAAAKKVDPNYALGIGAGADVNLSEYAPNAPVVKQIEAVNKPNVSLRYLNSYLKFPPFAEPEPPADTQAWYQDMSDLTQKLWASSSSNAAALLSASAKEFQSQYLNSGS